MSSTLRTAADAVGNLLGPALLALQARRREDLVLLYHRVSPVADPAYPPLHPDDFARHLDLVAKHLDVAPLPVLLDELRRGGRPGGRCAITFDDGFTDFLEHAYPLLEARSIPVTHYVVSECVRARRPTWNYRLNRVVTAEGGDGRQAKHDLGTVESSARDARLAERERAAGLDETDPSLVLGPDDLRSTDPAIVDWQSHGATHSMVPALSATALHHELTSSKEAIESWTGRPVTSFSYPNGAYTPSADATVRAAGYASGVVVGDRPVRAGASVLSVPRIDVGGRPPALLALAATGIITAARRLRR